MFLFQLKLSGAYKVRCLFAKKDIGVISKSFKALVNPMGVVMLKLCPVHTKKKHHSKHASKRHSVPMNDTPMNVAPMNATSTEHKYVYAWD